MTTNPNIRREAEKVSSEPGQCVHCSSGWVYEVEPDTGEDVAMGVGCAPKARR
jgi:hypothetical protein